MKKYIFRIIALLIFASAISSCSLEYRNAHRHPQEGNRGRDRDRGDHH
jgi:hypothetical protein